ncbi:MAG: hypothetical protein PQJ59_12055 [Spirochaetales bacterium]|nr:hypothetical protein [Spirochaetales bacterium]
MKYYPRLLAGKLYWGIILLSAVMFLRLWHNTHSVWSLITGIVLSILAVVWISPPHYGIRWIEITGDTLVVAFRKWQSSYNKSDLLKVKTNNNGEVQFYIFKKNGVSQRITPVAYRGSVVLLKELEVFCSS